MLVVWAVALVADIIANSNLATVGLLVVWTCVVWCRWCSFPDQLQDNPFFGASMAMALAGGFMRNSDLSAWRRRGWLVVLRARELRKMSPSNVRKKVLPESDDTLAHQDPAPFTHRRTDTAIALPSPGRDHITIEIPSLDPPRELSSSSSSQNFLLRVLRMEEDLFRSIVIYL